MISATLKGQLLEEWVLAASYIDWPSIDLADYLGQLPVKVPATSLAFLLPNTYGEKTLFVVEGQGLIFNPVIFSNTIGSDKDKFLAATEGVVEALRLLTTGYPANIVTPMPVRGLDAGLLLGTLAEEISTKSANISRTVDLLSGSLNLADGSSTVLLDVLPLGQGESDGYSLGFRFIRVGSTAGNLVVRYSISGSATPAIDYSINGVADYKVVQSVMIQSGDSEAFVSAKPIDDAAAEFDETIELKLEEGQDYARGTSQAVPGVIFDNDIPVSYIDWSFTDDAGEVQSPYSSFDATTDDSTPTLRGSLSAALSGSQLLRIFNGETLLGTASVNNRDRSWSYTPSLSNGSYAFVAKVEDLSKSGLYGPASAARSLKVEAAKSSSIVSLAISSPSVVTEDGPSNLVYTFTRTGSTAAPLTVNYTVGGNARAGTDYTGIDNSRTVRFSAGVSKKSVIVNPTANTRDEANKTVSIAVSSGNGYTLGDSAVVTGTIADDDIIGTSGFNKLVGTTINEFIDGRGNRDSLTGGVGPDRFGFRFGESSVAAIDAITDFQFGSDKISVFSSASVVPIAFSRAANNTKATTLSSLARDVFLDANGALSGNQALAAKAAVLVRATSSAIAGTYILVNDATQSFSAANDLAIKITNANVSLPALGAIRIDTVFM